MKKKNKIILWILWYVGIGVYFAIFTLLSVVIIGMVGKVGYVIALFILAINLFLVYKGAGKFCDFMGLGKKIKKRSK